MAKTKTQTPAQLLTAFMEKWETTPYELSHLYPMHQSTLSRLANGMSRITPKLAGQLADIFDTEPLYWLIAQAHEDGAAIKKTRGRKFKVFTKKAQDELKARRADT